MAEPVMVIKSVPETLLRILKMPELSVMPTRQSLVGVDSLDARRTYALPLPAIAARLAVAEEVVFVFVTEDVSGPATLRFRSAVFVPAVNGYAAVWRPSGNRTPAVV